MKDYSEIVEALRHCANHDLCYNRCRYFALGEADGDYSCIDKLNLDAAAAIEELVEEVRK